MRICPRVDCRRFHAVFWPVPSADSRYKFIWGGAHGSAGGSFRRPLVPLSAARGRASIPPPARLRLRSARPPHGRLSERQASPLRVEQLKAADGRWPHAAGRRLPSWPGRAGRSLPCKRAKRSRRPGLRRPGETGPRTLSWPILCMRGGRVAGPGSLRACSPNDPDFGRGRRARSSCRADRPPAVWPRAGLCSCPERQEVADLKPSRSARARSEGSPPP